MADSDIDRELKALLEQLSDEDLNAITRKLGLDQHEPRKTPAADHQDRAVEAAKEGEAVCSFCGQDSQRAGMMVSNRKGQFVCRGCLAKFRNA